MTPFSPRSPMSIFGLAMAPQSPKIAVFVVLLGGGKRLQTAQAPKSYGVKVGGSRSEPEHAATPTESKSERGRPNGLDSLDCHQ